MTGKESTQHGSRAKGWKRGAWGFSLGTFSSHLAAVALVAIATGLCDQVRGYLSPINMVMPYLLAVVVAALFLGRNPAMLTALLGVLAFDFFFVPPRFSLTIADKEYLVTFLTLFTVGIVISTLVAQARERLEALRLREMQTSALYHLGKHLTAAADTPAILAAVIREMERTTGAELAMLLPGEEGLLVAGASPELVIGPEELEIANWCLQSRRLAGYGTTSYSDSRFTFLPLKALAETLGVMAIELEGRENPLSPQTRRLLEAFATQTTLALERVRLMGEAQEAHILKAREKLETALLNSISHDLRTPLAAITGALSALSEEREKLSAKSRSELLETAREEASRLNRFVGNLLDMTRLEAGALRPRLEACDVQDLIGCALAAMEKRLGNKEVKVSLPPSLPLVKMDLVLMIQVLVNLIDNAVKYTPPDGVVEITASCEENRLSLEVADRGPGLPEQDLPRIFEKFYRTPVPEGVGGTGLGLSICHGIVEAHGGSIQARNREGGGLRVIITLPQETAKEEAISAHEPKG